MRLSKALTIALTSLILLSGSATAQREERRPVPPTGLSLEVLYYKGQPPTYMTVPPEDGKPGGTWYGRFNTVPGWQLPAGELPVRAVNIITRMEHDTVTINVSVFQGVKYHDRETAVGTYHVQENESVLITELGRFGVEPFRISVVRITPRVPAPPLVKSLAKSLEVVTIEPIISTLPAYKMTLHNVSEKNISALAIDVFVAGRRSLSSMPHGKEGLPVISAGAFYESNEPIEVRARPTATGYTPDSPTQETIITAVVFTDGSYEGDPARAAEARALTLGRRSALTRLLPLFAAADDASTSEQTQAAQVAAFRTRVLGLSDEVDDQTLAQLSTEFPGLDQKKQDELKKWIESSVHLLGRGLLKELDSVEAEQPGAFQAWLVKVGERYRSWLARL